MNQCCKDVFEEYELPFETYFSRKITHNNQIHNEFELIWLIRGNAVVHLEGKKYLLTDQTLFMVNIGERHSISTSEDSIVITYRFKREYLRSNNLAFESLRFQSRVQPFEELVIKYKEVPLLIAQLIKLLLSGGEEKAIRYKVIGYYNMFIYELFTMLKKEKYLDVKKKNYENYIDRLEVLIEYINNNFSHKISLDEVSEKVHLSKYRLSHFIKEYLGISFQEYVSNKRLDFALKELKFTDKSIKQISHDAGFSDCKYLTKAIKEKLGITALKYRKLLCHEDDDCCNTMDFNDFKQELELCLTHFQDKIESKYFRMVQVGSDKL